MATTSTRTMSNTSKTTNPTATRAYGKGSTVSRLSATGSVAASVIQEERHIYIITYIRTYNIIIIAVHGNMYNIHVMHIIVYIISH